MSSNNFRHTRRLHRRHTLQRELVDALPWPHPRPTRDWRLIGVHMALIWTAAGQAVFGPPFGSVQYKGFGWPATIAFGVVLILCCGLYLTAAFCKSQYASFGYELSACVGFTGSMIIYCYVLILTIPQWALTYNWSFCAGLAVGNAARAWILIRRLW
jgi:hypothetical protein